MLVTGNSILSICMEPLSLQMDQNMRVILTKATLMDMENLHGLRCLKATVMKTKLATVTADNGKLVKCTVRAIFITHRVTYWRANSVTVSSPYNPVSLLALSKRNKNMINSYLGLKRERKMKLKQQRHFMNKYTSIEFNPSPDFTKPYRQYVKMAGLLSFLARRSLLSR